eukprot:CAMPEP_0174872640 /NCGR_PEP_ID=MMETSP1114-20130205/73580_1 /TAXON_ID=312471 /ORGANISM="Neobodo designis, Strain CCAP 1951/1" /LENGTH=254 /DNA_ID=CAMNT_0016107949 /DNA_START=1 /DNA_END=761 /DNA_ORIENTATION=-
MDCFVARCHLNATAPVVRNMTAWRYTYSTQQKYDNNTEVAGENVPGTHVNEVDCEWKFRCPPTTPFIGVYASGYVGPMMLFDEEDDHALGTYHAHFNHTGGAEFGYLMPGAGVRIIRTTLPTHMEGHSFGFEIHCFVRRCTNNHTEDARLVLPASGGPNEFPDFRYYINEECPMKLTCQNENHYLGIAAGLFFLNNDMLWAQDETFPIPYTFEFPVYRHYTGEASRKGDHPVRAGFLFRTPTVQVWLNTTMRRR